MTKSFNPKMLILAREARGWTQEDLAEHLPTINQSNLSKVERGELGVTETTLDTIAEALHFPKDFFLQEDVRPALSNLYYRKQYKVTGKTVKTLRAAIQILTRAIGYLMEDVDMDNNLHRLRFNISEGWTPETAADATRKLLGVPEGPIKDIIKTVEAAGIIVYFVNFDIDGFDGVSAFTDNGWPIIFLNGNRSNDRIIMSLVHEMAHIAMHIPFVVEPFRDEEKEAKTYAGAFLLPAREVKGELMNLSYRKLLPLKEYWRVSKAALIYRAYELKAITPTKYNYLNKERSARGERLVEDGFVDIDSPTLLNKIISLYKVHHNYTADDFAKLMKIRSEDYCKHFETNNAGPKLKLLRPTI